MHKLTLRQRDIEKKSLTSIILQSNSECFKARVTLLVSLYGFPTMFYFLQETFNPMTSQHRWWAAGLLWDIDIDEGIAESLCWDVLLDFFENHKLVVGEHYFVDENLELSLRNKGVKIFKKFCRKVVFASSATNSNKFLFN